MGTWGHESFANDTSIDWTYGLEGVLDLSLVEEAVDAVLRDGEDDVLDADLACDVLAACEVMARLKGNWGRRDAYSATADRWVEAHPQPVPSKLAARAGRALDRVLGDESELRDLWDEGAGGDDWRAAVADLRRRVEG